MQPSTLLEKIVGKGCDKEAIAAKIVRDPSQVAILLQGLTSARPQVKFGCSKVLRLISAQDPALLYPHMDLFIGLLEHKNTFLRLDAVRLIANLATIDSEGKFDRVFDRFFAPISGPTMIPAATVMGAGAGIARARPELADRIAAEILKVEGAKYATAECHNIALGHAIRSFETLYDLIEDRDSVARLVRKQLENKRPATRRKAEVFVRAHGL